MNKLNVKVQLPKKVDWEQKIVPLLIAPDKTKYYQLSPEERKDYKTY